MDSPLDPQAVYLAQAIRKQEGGDFNASNDDAGGWSIGAYQWHGTNKDTAMQHFKSDAVSYGLNPDDFSPANQNHVAYAKIKALKDQGRNPGEIAAIWNGARVVNGKYEAINPEYAKSVYSHYLTLKNGSGAPTGQLNPEGTPQSGSGVGYLPMVNDHSLPPVTQPTPEQVNPTAGQRTLQAGNTVAGVLGMQPFGQGIATTGRVFSGGVSGDIAAQSQDAAQIGLKQLPAGQANVGLLQQLHALVLSGVPKNDPRRVRLQRAIAQAAGLSAQAPTEDTIDPGTTLKNKDILKSAGATALGALSGGSMPYEGMQSFNLASRAGGVGAPLAYRGASTVVSKAAPIVRAGLPLIGKVASVGINAGLLKELWDLSHRP